ncbi:retrovirus-related pol polyprotein from transposon TNT 1-94 [Tanacetum coccineum]
MHSKQVHVTHARIVTESVPEPAKKKTGSRSTRSVVIQDTPSAPKSKPAASKPNLKGVQSLTPEEQEAADVMQALKESKKTKSRQPCTRGSSEGTGRIPGVPDESTVVSATSSEGTGTKPGVPDEEKVSSEEKVILEWGSEQESEYSKEELSEKEEIVWIDSEEDDEKKDDSDDDKSIDLQMTDDEETDDEVLHEDTDPAKEDAKNTEEAKDDSKKAKLPPTSSSLSVSSGFVDQFLKLSSDTSLIGTVKDTTNVEIISLLDIKIQSKVPHIQSPSVLKVPVSVISEPSLLTPVQETHSAAPVTTLPPLSVSTIPHLRVIKLEKDVSELKKIDHSAKALATLKSQVLMTPTINLEQESKKSASEILKIKEEQDEKQKMPKYTIKSTDKEALKKYDQKSALYQTMHEIKSFNKNPNNHRLYHALMEALIKDENAMGKSASAKEPVEEPIAEVVLKTWSLCFGVPSDMCITKTLQRGSSIRAKGLYKFKEGDFVDLHLNDIEDMLILAVLAPKLVELYNVLDETTQDVRDGDSSKCTQFSLGYNKVDVKVNSGRILVRKGHSLWSSSLTSRCVKEGSFRIWSDANPTDCLSLVTEYSEEEVTETNVILWELYMADRVTMDRVLIGPKCRQDNFEQRPISQGTSTTFRGSIYEVANEHIEKVLKIVDLFHIPNITIDQVMLRAFPMSLTGAASRWLRNKPTGSITTWEDLKTKFLSKYCPPARTAKKMEEINNFQNETTKYLYQLW